MDQSIMRWVLRAASSAALVLGAAGCGSSGDDSSTKQSGPVVPKVAVPPRRSGPIEEPEPEVPRVVEAAPAYPAGPWLEWQVAQAPVVSGKSYLKLSATPDADGVLELSSYDAPRHEEFPSFFLRARAKGTTLAELLDQKLAADLYIQVEADGNLLHKLPGQPLELQITDIEGKKVRGTFSGQVHDVDTGNNGPIHGKFQAVLDAEVPNVPARASRAAARPAAAAQSAPARRAGSEAAAPPAASAASEAAAGERTGPADAPAPPRAAAAQKPDASDAATAAPPPATPAKRPPAKPPQPAPKGGVSF